MSLHQNKLNFSIFLLVCSTLICSGQENLPPHNAADPKAIAVSIDDVATRERFWPYQVSLKVPQPKTTIPLGLPGVLLRVEANSSALIDFGRDGLHRVPVSDTDLIESAELIRLGLKTKDAPNFTFLIGARLVQSDAEKMQPLKFEQATGKSAYLCLFVSTAEIQIEEITKALGELRVQPDVMPLLFPIGETPDHEIYKRLKAAKCSWSFVYNHLAESYARGLIPEGISTPAVMLISNEGRLIFYTEWSAGVGAELKKALESQRTSRSTALPIQR